MTVSASPRLAAYAGLCAAGLIAGLVLRRAEPVVLAAPFALALAVGLAGRRPARVRLALLVEPVRALEGDEIVLRLDLESERAVERLELLPSLPDGLTPVDGFAAVSLRLRPGEPRSLELRTRADRWGGYALGRVHLRARGPLGLLVEEERVDRLASVRVYPREERLRALLSPRETQLTTGNEVSRARGDGIEFADVRPYVPGDRVRRVNWRASARRGELWVNEAHPERNADVILFLDSFAEARSGGRGTLDAAVRAAATLADAYLDRRDRVGLVSFGGVLRWLLPGMGRRQAYRIADALLDTEIVFSYAWKDVAVIPPRTLPPHALVLALSPLLDERSVAALLDLRARGYDLAVVDVSPLPFVEPGRDDEGGLGYRLWRLQREALRFRYEQAGVAVAEWRDGEALQGPIEEVRAFRRHALRVRV